MGDLHKKNSRIHRDSGFIYLRCKEELGELIRSFLELRGSKEKRNARLEELQKRWTYVI